MKSLFFQSITSCLQSVTLLALIAPLNTVLAAKILPYGVLDTGLLYSYEKHQNDFSGSLANDYTPSHSSNNFRMEPSINMGSRFGIRASEMVLGHTQVSIVLENGFSPDTGAENNPNHFFDRGASLSLSGPWGQFSIGRMGTFTSSIGAYNVFTARTDVMDGGFYWFTRGVYDNMISLQSPTFYHTTIAAQYSFETHSEREREGSSDAARYAALAIVHDQGALQAVLVGEAHLRESDQPSQYRDAYAIGIGGNWTLENTTLYFGAQYGWNESIFGWISSNDFLSSEWLTQHQGTYGQFDGYNLHVGINQQILGGNWQFGLFYNRANGNVYTLNGLDNFSEDIKKYGFISMYSLLFGKKAQIYTGLSYTRDEVHRNEPLLGSGVFTRNSFLATVGLSIGF